MEMLRFAKLVSDVSGISGRSLTDQEIDRLARTLGVPTTNGRVPVTELDNLIGFMDRGEKIAAIKVYRALTGADLGYAKAAVEVITDRGVHRSHG